MLITARGEPMTAILDYISHIEQIEKLENSSDLEKDMRFYQELVALKAQYNYTAADVLRLLKPATSVAAPSLVDELFEVLLSEDKLASVANSTAKTLRRYRNPHTGEVVETRGSNHSRLKEWKREYGADALAAWREL